MSTQRSQNELVEALVQTKLQEYLELANYEASLGSDIYKKHAKALKRVIKAIENVDFE